MFLQSRILSVELLGKLWFMFLQSQITPVEPLGKLWFMFLQSRLLSVVLLGKLRFMFLKSRIPFVEPLGKLWFIVLRCQIPSLNKIRLSFQNFRYSQKVLFLLYLIYIFDFLDYNFKCKNFQEMKLHFLCKMNTCNVIKV